MGLSQIILIVINVLGGAAVIGSYIYGLQDGGANALWGGVPENIRTLYGVSMIIAAVGYLALLYFLVFKVNPAQAMIAGTLGYWLFFVIFILILAPSAAWMPLSNTYVAGQSAGVWIAIRTVLFIVGLASLAMVGALLTLNTKTPAVPYWLAVAGSGYFAFHTLVLDAIIWAALFK